jgi:hypothetical protein
MHRPSHGSWAAAGLAPAGPRPRTCQWPKRDSQVLLPGIPGPESRREHTSNVASRAFRLSLTGNATLRVSLRPTDSVSPSPRLAVTPGGQLVKNLKPGCQLEPTRTGCRHGDSDGDAVMPVQHSRQPPSLPARAESCQCRHCDRDCVVWAAPLESGLQDVPLGKCPPGLVGLGSAASPGLVGPRRRHRLRSALPVSGRRVPARRIRRGADQRPQRGGCHSRGSRLSRTGGRLGGRGAAAAGLSDTGTVSHWR